MLFEIITFTNLRLHLNEITSETSGKIGFTHHMACTETGLKTCERPAVFTLKPLRRKKRRDKESPRVTDPDEE